MSEVKEERELALPTGKYAYAQDTTKGNVKTYTGPTVINQTGQERPVIYDSESRQFVACSLEGSARNTILAGEGDYVVLENPSLSGASPGEASVENTPDLLMGQKVNIPGPCSFSLWPTQVATVISGHRLRRNQYLVLEVYNEEKARENWSKTIKESTGAEQDLAIPIELSVGSLLTIKGTEVSFYLPPTGAEVVPNQNGDHVRDAMTLETLEHCILIDEDGNKRYERGEQIVFPEPSEQFVENRGETKFRAVELNEIQGLHLKVISPYREEDESFGEGDELFITGKQTAIYFPRPEHSLISYDGKSKHYATAVPVGEGRYVLKRMKGEIEKVTGPAMLLPDPRHEVIIRRVLSDSQCNIMYPGNEEAAAYNRQMSNLLAKVPSTRQGAVSEGDAQRGTRKTQFATSASNELFMERSQVSHDQKLSIGDEFSRESTYTQPRTVTLDTKFQGVPAINVWTGYAVLIVNKQGNRRVVIGPDTVLMDYDEDMEALSLSTGKPKTTDVLYHTGYLRVTNNQVSDIVTEVYTKDHVKLTIKMVYRVNFEGESERWFTVENYVKLLCDHSRSMVKGAIRKTDIRDFYSTGSDFLRDLLLGKREGDSPRPGLSFSENNMHVKDIEVLSIRIEDEDVRKLLEDSQREVVSESIEVERQERALVFNRRKEAVTRELLEEADETSKTRNSLAIDAVDRDSRLVEARTGAELEAQVANLAVIKAEEENENERNTETLQREKAEEDQKNVLEGWRSQLRITEGKAMTEAMVQRFGAAQEGFSEALLTLSREESLTKIAQAASVQTALGGNSLVEVLQNIFAGTGLQEALTRIAGNGNLAAVTHDEITQ